jgi:hypothetical protein
MGLKESPNKTQIVAKSEQHKAIIRDRFPDWLKDEATILGVTTVTKTRPLSAKENERLDDAWSRVVILSAAPLVWTLKIKAFQYLVISKAAYGWCGTNPQKHIVDRFFTALSQILKTGKGASRELRKMFYGAITYLSMTILTRRWGRLARGLHKDRSMYKWKKQPFSSVHNLRLGIKNLGFKEVAPWTWEPPEDLKGIFTGDDKKLCLDPESRQPLELQLHILRKMFRVNSFLNWCNHKKRRCCLVSKSW